MKKAIRISGGGATLPELAKRVIREPGAVEYIEHRTPSAPFVLRSTIHRRYRTSGAIALFDPVAA